MYIILNGDILPKEEAKISVFEHGYMYGLGVFETFRVYQGHPFLFDDHLDRLSKGIQEIGIEYALSKEILYNQLKQLLRANKLENAYVRLNISAGMGDVGLQTHAYTKPTQIMYMKPLPKEFSGIIEKEGILLKIKRNSPEGAERLKSHHFLNNILGKKEIGDRLSAEGIFLNRKGYIAEGVVSNLFWVKKNKLFTPGVSTGILNGITRQFVIELAKKLKMNVNEGSYTAEELVGIDEAFVTNSIQEIVPLWSLNGTSLPGVEGKVTASFIELYKSYTSRLWSKNEIHR